MPMYTVSGTVTVSCWTQVEAKDEAEALRIARKRDVSQIHIDHSYPADEFWHLDSDGMPADLHVE